MITIEIQPRFQESISSETLQEFTNALFQMHKIPVQDGLSITVGDDPLLQKLNAQYLGIDAPTDVLSFPAGFEDPENGGYFYGDIIISYQKAGQQAAAAGTTALDEIKLLIVHGFLHLLGYDHADETQKKDMWAIQDQLLISLGIQARPED